MKKLLYITFISVLFLLISGCGNVYEDTNGADNYTLQSITDENIIYLETGSSGLVYTEQNLGFLHSSEYSAKNHNGVDQIYLTNLVGKSDMRIYIGHLNVTKGNFKLVVINNDKIIKEIPLDTFAEEFYFKDISGTFSIHVAGESAAFEFYIDVQ